MIEPSGVGKLSDIIRAVQNLDAEDVLLNGFTTIADAKKCKMYMKNFGEFFNDQIENAGCIVLSHTGGLNEEKIAEAVALIKEKNSTATIVTTPWELLDGKQLLMAMERRDTIEEELARLANEMHEHQCDDPECSCHHRHGEDECCHHEHHHHDDEECDDEECSCHHHHEHGEHHHHHHHHHADEVFVSVGAETTKKFGKDELKSILEALSNETYGIVLRAKGIVECKCGKWLHFDYVPGEGDVREGSAAVIGRLCVIGSKLDKENLSKLFGVNLK